MIRNFKALGLALVAAFAMSAVAASAASAQSPWHFGSTASHTVLTGEQHNGLVVKDKFTTDIGSVECAHATYTGTVSGTTATEVTVTPAYTGCNAFGIVGVPVDVNGCAYIFTAGTKTAAGDYEGGLIHIECPANKRIEVTAPGCTVTVEEQTITGGSITFTNKGTGATAEVTVDANLAGIHYTEHTEGIAPTCDNHTVTTTNGTYVGSGTVTGETAAQTHLGVSVTGNT